MKPLKHYLCPFIYIASLYLVVCTVLRAILLLDPNVRDTLTIIDVIGIFVVGLLNNACVFFVLSVFFWLYLLFVSDNKLRKPTGIILFWILIGSLVYVIFFNNIIKQYGSILINIIVTFLLIKTVLWSLLLWLPQYRVILRKILYFITIFVFLSAICLNGISEYFFWKEFGVRYNFIAVDYLIYTNEVIGNIMESYPVFPMFTVLGVIVLGLTFFIFRRTAGYFDALPSVRSTLYLSIIAALSITIGVILMPLLSQLSDKENVYANELEADGVYKFYRAYLDNHLKYSKFYPLLDDCQALHILQESLAVQKGDGILRKIQDSLPEIHKNVVLISVESLSADFLAHYGNTKKLTPFLDSLADNSLMFTNLYAVGNRTVRGLEALTLCIPPSPGESIIKQKDNKDKFTTGAVFRQKGYVVKFMYGGYSYFDNMKDFYQGNGYEVVDRNNFSQNEITFANVWGVCDEDMARKAVKVLNQDAETGKPFFAHWMTVSNHRPFTYPNGKINIPGDAKSREGGVKYTDFALRYFFSLAKKQSWFSNTVFIIVADHCASSAGRVALPLEKYRIPCMVYSPGFIQPKKIRVLMSQIDIMPTVFGLLHFHYSSKFIGRDVLKTRYQPRAFIATYQDMGYIRDSVLTVLSPVRQVQQFYLQSKSPSKLMESFRYQFEELPKLEIDNSLKNQAIGYYQATSWLLEHKSLQIE